MRLWRFNHTQEENQELYITERGDGLLDVRFSPFTMVLTWEEIDKYKAEGKLNFIKEYEIK